MIPNWAGKEEEEEEGGGGPKKETTAQRACTAVQGTPPAYLPLKPWKGGMLPSRRRHNRLELLCKGSGTPDHVSRKLETTSGGGRGDGTDK